MFSPFINDMWMKYALGLLSAAIVTPAAAQIEKHFTVETNEEAQHVNLMLTAPSGICYVMPTRNPHPVNVYGHTTNQRTTPSLSTSIDQSVHQVNVNFATKESESLSTTISRRMFGGSSDESWDKYKVYLSENESFELNMLYDAGEAFIDLSGLAVRRCKVDAGNADVEMSYREAFGNQVEMDTFMAKVDMGTLTVDKVNLARSKHIIADVGFGAMTLTFDDQELRPSKVVATVGAGSLEVILESPTQPVIVRMHNSPLCHVKFSPDFQEISKNVWVNSAYHDGAKNLVTFDVEVSMGNLRFGYQE